MDHRISVFYPSDNDAGHVQAVISGDDWPVYQKLGFVKSVDDLQTKTKASKKAAADGSESNKG